ncbi:RNA polymerase recycling motor HelD [Bacillus massilioanorexius]|uniref:RNA polymerase recycling motor HelD n=1 Tax=Bacillus TaxID=1386 RepID=UPI0004771447|nr:MULTISPECIES: RNA polymerase recycling motor HelD [Bacillus]
MNQRSQDIQSEEARIQNVLHVINKKIGNLKGDSTEIKTDVIHLRKTFWDDVTVNVDNLEDAVETLASIKQQSELLSERERTHKQFDKQLKSLSLLKESPYFGRVDFLENGEKNSDVVYLGTASLMDENGENFLIYDWRAPISSIYYDYSPGPAQYETLDGTIKGNMELKRQFIIKNGHLKSMFDTGVTIGDELLKEVLGNNADNQMKNIVATIQKEQNQIIRNEKNKYLIVQGVAGSGKTSAALQRVAYLLYRHINKLTADHIMLFSPNPLFNSYVSTVLPNLGEDNMQQSTFQDFLEQQIGKKITIENAFTQMEYVLTHEHDKLYQARITGIQFKASMPFIKIMDQYISSLSKKNMKWKDISFRNQILVSSDQIGQYFYSLDETISIPNRIQSVSNWLLKEIRQKEKNERDKDWVADQIELLDSDEYTQVYQELQKKKAFSENSFNDFDRERKMLAKKVVQRQFKPIRKMIKKLKFIDLKTIYSQLFMQEKWKSDKFDFDLPMEWSNICTYTLHYIKENTLTFEDATPYLYLKARLEGPNSNNSIKHLFIDEAQDYSPFQFTILKQFFPSCKMTILGDFNQAIYAQSINAPTLLSNELYEDHQAEKMELLKSYRSTRQIVEFTKNLLESGNKFEAFNRNGQKPSITLVTNSEELHEKISERIQDLQRKGHQTIAVICKNNQECTEAYEQLKSMIPIQLLDDTTYSFNKGTVIIPSYLSKGIEFDAVIIYDASIHKYNREIERKLFYTACTRAMHELHLFAIEQVSPFLDTVSKEYYESYTIK